MVTGTTGMIGVGSGTACIVFFALNRGSLKAGLVKYSFELATKKQKLENYFLYKNSFNIQFD